MKNLEATEMKNYKRSEQQEKILLGMDLIYSKLIEFKRKEKSELVVWKNDKIVRIKP